MNSKEILYPWAIDDCGRRVYAKSILSANRHEHAYKCPHCKEPMIPVLGEHRIEHFRHLGQVCSYSNYIHSNAELIFIEEYKHCVESGIPFELEYEYPVFCNRACVISNPSICKARYNRGRINLSSKYKTAIQEAPVSVDTGSRRPDILLLSDSGEQIWIEICVTSEVKAEKQKQGKIIEIKINSIEDAERIFKSHIIKQSNDKDNWVRLFNIGNVILDEPLQSKPPCDKYFVYEVGAGYMSAKGYISDSLPKNKENIKYRSVLHLNWHKTHDATGSPYEYLTQSKLEEHCFSRYFSGKTDDLMVSSLIVDEFRSQRESEEVTAHKRIQRTSSVKKEQAIVETTPAQRSTVPCSSVKWIDLGLPSGRLWPEEDGLYDVSGDTAHRYRIPTYSDVEELKRCCKQEADYDANRFVFTGPNGNKIRLRPYVSFALSGRGPNRGDNAFRLYSLLPGNYIHYTEDDYLFRLYIRDF